MLKKMRIWPVVLIFVLDIAVVIWFHFQWGINRQNFTLAVIGAQIGAAFLLLNHQLANFGGILH